MLSVIGLVLALVTAVPESLKEYLIVVYVFMLVLTIVMVIRNEVLLGKIDSHYQKEA